MVDLTSSFLSQAANISLIVGLLAVLFGLYSLLLSVKSERQYKDFKSLAYKYEKLYEDNRYDFSRFFSEKDPEKYLIQKIVDENYTIKQEIRRLQAEYDNFREDLDMCLQTNQNISTDFGKYIHSNFTNDTIRSANQPIIKETDDFLATEKVTSIYRQVSSEFSHSLKTPLSSVGVAIRAISTNIEVLSESDDHERTELIANLNSLLENALSSLETIKGILSEGAGFLPIDSKRLSLNPIIHKIIRMCKDSTSSKCNVSSSLDGIPDIKSNWLCVFLPIMQIMENSFEAVSENGNIWITGAYSEGTVEIQISNDGKPIPQNIKEQIFEDGFSQKGYGRGLGLKITKRCVEYIDGEVSLVKSDEDGTVFSIKFKPEEVYE